MFYYLIEKHMQKFRTGTFEGKNMLSEKVTYVPLAPSHSIVYHVYSKISLQPFKSMGLENHVYE